MAQAIMQQSRSHLQSNWSWWKVIYYLWPKLSSTQQLASSSIGDEAFHGFWSISTHEYPYFIALSSVHCFFTVMGMKRLSRSAAGNPHCNINLSTGG
jgi:hypothetical protein